MVLDFFLLLDTDNVDCFGDVAPPSLFFKGRISALTVQLALECLGFSGVISTISNIIQSKIEYLDNDT